MDKFTKKGESRIEEKEVHNQIIHFVGGQKRYIRNVIYIWENEMTHILTLEGTEWIINKNNVLCVEKVKIT